MLQEWIKIALSVASDGGRKVLKRLPVSACESLSAAHEFRGAGRESPCACFAAFM
jgi:hypothetical protein